MAARDQIVDALKERGVPVDAVKFVHRNPLSGFKRQSGWLLKKRGETVWKSMGSDAQDALRAIKQGRFD